MPLFGECKTKKSWRARDDEILARWNAEKTVSADWRDEGLLEPAYDVLDEPAHRAHWQQDEQQGSWTLWNPNPNRRPSDLHLTWSEPVNKEAIDAAIKRVEQETLHLRTPRNGYIPSCRCKTRFR